jgi:hypothetical protein
MVYVYQHGQLRRIQLVQTSSNIVQHIAVHSRSESCVVLQRCVTTIRAGMRLQCWLAPIMVVK